MARVSAFRLVNALSVVALAATGSASTQAQSKPSPLTLLEPGAPGVDASAIPEYTNVFDVVEVQPDGTERVLGTWDDRVEILRRNGRSVLRRVQSSKTATGTSAHLDEVDQKTLQPLRARYEANKMVVSDSTWEGRRLTSRDVTTPAGLPSTERLPVTMTIEFSKPVFDWHLWGVLLSSFPLTDGYEAAFLAHATSDAEAPLLRRLTLRVAGRETIDLGVRGRVNCYVVRVDAGTPWTFWISTTRRPVPVVQLKIEAPDGVSWWWRPQGRMADGSKTPPAGDKQSAPDPNAEREVRDMEARWRDAWLSANADALDWIHADDYIAIPNIGTVSSKAEVMADVRRGIFRYSSMEHSEVTVRIYGTTAVVVGRTTNEGRRGDRDVSGDFRYTRMYVKRHGRWQVVLAQYTRISAAAQQESCDMTRTKSHGSVKPADQGTTS